MAGRIRRKLLQESVPLSVAERDVVCPLCERLIPESLRDEHHLLPKSKGGKQTVTLHRICHRQIHALFDDRTLAEYLSAVVALKTHPEMKRFISWVKSKPPEFFERTRRSNRFR